MTWTRTGDTLTHHPTGFKIEFRPITGPEKNVRSWSVVAQYGDKRWRGTMVKSVRKDRTGMDEMRMLQEAKGEWERLQRAQNVPWDD